jgi:hypothetical protein
MSGVLASVPSTTIAPARAAAELVTEPRVVEATALRLQGTAHDFARAPLSRKIAALAEVRARLFAHGHALARLGCAAKGIGDGGFGEELLAAP